MNNYSDLNKFLSNLKVDKNKKIDISINNRQEPQPNITHNNSINPESNFNFNKKKTTEQALQERQEMNSRLFERSFNSVIPPKFSENTESLTKKNTDNNEYMNKKIFDRHLLFSDSNENKVFDKHPSMTRSISNNKNKNRS